MFLTVGDLERWNQYSDIVAKLDDIEFKDAYKYDKVSGLVIPQGFIFNIK